MKVSLLIFGAAVLFSSALKADVIYNNFGPSQSFNTTFGLNLNTLGVGVAFTPLANSYLLDEIDFVVARFNTDVANPNTIQAKLYADVGGLPATTALESLTFTGTLGVLLNPPDITGPVPTVIQLQSSGRPLMIAGQQYWVVLVDQTNGNVGDLIWNSDGNSTTGIVASKEQGQWSRLGNTAGALEVQGTIAPVPEPGTLLTLACGLAGLVAVRRRAA